MVILLFIVIIILLAVFFPTFLFLLFSGALGIIGDMTMLLIAFILSMPIIYLIFKLKSIACAKIKKDTIQYKKNTLDSIENDLSVNNKNILIISILTGVIYGFIGLVIYDETHTHETYSSSIMFMSAFVPSFVGVAISYNIIMIYRFRAKIGEMDKAKEISLQKQKERELRKQTIRESMNKAGN